MGDSGCGIGVSHDSVATCANHPQRISVAYQQGGGQHWCSRWCINGWINHMDAGISGCARGFHAGLIGRHGVVVLALLLKGYLQNVVGMKP